MTDNVTKFIKLKDEYSELPVIAWVDGEIVAEDSCNRWAGRIGVSCIESYIFYEMYLGYEELVTKDDTEVLEDYLLDTTEMSDKEIEDYINNLNWKKAIFLNIDLPDFIGGN